MHQTADAGDVSYIVKTILKYATDEYVAWEKRLNHAHDPATRRSLKAKPGMEYLQSKSLAHVGGSYMLVLGLRSRTVPF
jgi:hypothetical protein